jgi:hypothetical protein
MRIFSWKLALGIFVAVLNACRADAVSYCEMITYKDHQVALSIPENYYLTARSTHDTISLMIRYADLSAPRKIGEGYDRHELSDPNWRLDRSHYTALVQIYRISLRNPSQPSDFRASYPTLTEVVTDLDGWTKLKTCLSGCQEVFYVNDDWRKRGTDNILCYEDVAERDPLFLSCTAHDHIEGLLVDFNFPAVQKQHFGEFRGRVVEILQRFIADAKKDCVVAQ